MSVAYTESFRISSFCPGGSCVQAAITPGGDIELHHTENPQREPHVFSLEEWTAFVTGVKAGEFDTVGHPQQGVSWLSPNARRVAQLTPLGQ